VAVGHWDLYIIFISKALSLLKNDGHLSFIVPSSFSKEKYGKSLRELIVKNYSLTRLVEFGTEAVFDKVARQYQIFIVKNKLNPENVTELVRYEKGIFNKTGSIKQKEFLDFNNCTFRTDLKQTDINIMKKISQNSVVLGKICCINPGVVAHSRKGSPIKFTKDDVIHDTYAKGYKKYFEGKEMSRYNIKWNDHFIDYESKAKYFHRPKFPQLFENNKIIVRRISGENDRIIVTYDENQFYTNDNLLHLILWNDEVIKLQTPGKLGVYKPYGSFSLEYLTGIIGSRLISYLFSKFFATSTLQGTYSGIYPEDLRKIPIKIAEKTQSDKLSELVRQIIRFNKSLSELNDKKTDEKIKLEEEISKTDVRIDELVYKIYGITTEEKKVIEEG
jgi:hypothetical protein